VVVYDTIWGLKSVFVIYTTKGIFYIKVDDGGVIAMHIPPPLKGWCKSHEHIITLCGDGEMQAS